MRTIEVCVYEFSELSDSAKQKALNQFEPSVDHVFEDAYSTINKFHEVFGTKTGRNSLGIYTGDIDDNILNLQGFRLQKYIWNNFGSALFKRKYIKNGELSEKIKPTHPMRRQYQITNDCANKGKFSNSYYSNLKKDNCCVLTGVCYDDDILEPIYDFLERRVFDRDNISYGVLFQRCLYSIRKSVDEEIENIQSDESKAEEFEENAYEFLEDGTRF